MAVEKLSVSFDPDLGDDIRAAADDSDQSISAWLAEAARERLRQLALQHALTEILEAERLTTDDLGRAEDLLAGSFWTGPKAARTRRRTGTKRR
jgi:hypothetical protein